MCGVCYGDFAWLTVSRKDAKKCYGANFSLRPCVPWRLGVKSYLSLFTLNAAKADAPVPPTFPLITNVTLANRGVVAVVNPKVARIAFVAALRIWKVSAELYLPGKLKKSVICLYVKLFTSATVGVFVLVIFNAGLLGDKFTNRTPAVLSVL